MYTGKGRCACAGITFGKVLHIKTPEVVASDRDCLSVDQELELFEGALSKAATELDRLIEKAREEIGDEQAEIFEIHRMMLEDPDICDNIRDRIKKGGINAADAAVSVGKEQAADFEALDDPYMRERAADVKDVTGRIARILRGGETVELTEACVIVADDLQPSQTVALDRSLILGFVLRHGTQNSHASILARTMNIPLIINSNLPSSLDGDGKAATESEEAMDLTGHTIGLDAVKGEFFIDPDQNTITKLMAAKDVFEQQRIRQLALRGQPGISKTGHRVYTFANIGQPDDVEQVLENDGEGIGLFRSEFLYLGRLIHLAKKSNLRPTLR